MSVVWNPWHGCKKHSEGCLNCYVYRIDSAHGKDPSEVSRNADFSLPVKRKRDGEYKIPPGETVYTCFSSDFLLDTADEWRSETWSFIRERSDLTFIFLTKRILRLGACLPPDWGSGYENVVIGCTCENQRTADERLPEFLSLPIRHRVITCEPLLGEIDLLPYLSSRKIEEVVAGGESGNEARICDFEWIKKIRDDCESTGTDFYFKQTGARFVKDGSIYRIKRQFQHSQAKKAGINIMHSRPPLG